MKIITISDQHGYLPPIPPCDVLLIAGDICPTKDHHVGFQEHWLDTQFRWWLKELPVKKIIGIAGNHDLIFQYGIAWGARVPALPWEYLQDKGIEYEGLKFYGTPWQPYFFDWAFNLYEDGLVEKWKNIPNDTDVLIVHGPPHGYGDNAPRPNGKGYENTGSPGLLAKIEEIKPKLVVFGHIHEGRGQWQLGPTILANTTLVNRKYELVYEPMVFEISPTEKKE